MGKYVIKDLEKLSGVKSHTIRMWEQRYDLLNPERTSTNIRQYSDEDLKQLLNVALLIRNGHKISKVSKLPNELLHREVEDIFNRDLEADLAYEAPINGMIVAMIELNEDMFERIFSTVVLRQGFIGAIIKVVYPFLAKVGMMWGINQVNPAQEHFVSNLIRQKLIVAIDGITAKPDPNDCFVLYLREGELHEIGLLLCSFLLKAHGKRVVYLGQNVPYKDLHSVCGMVQFHNIFTLVINPSPPEELTNYFAQLAEDWPGKKVYISGNPTVLDPVELPASMQRIGSVEELLEFLQ